VSREGERWPAKYGGNCSRDCCSRLFLCKSWPSQFARSKEEEDGEREGGGGGLGKGGLLERGNGDEGYLRKRAYEYLHGVIISSPGGKPDFRRGEFSAYYFASARYISTIVLSLGDFRTTRCAPIVLLSILFSSSHVDIPESLSAIFGALTPSDFLRARHQWSRNGANFNPRSGFHCRFLPVYLESRPISRTHSGELKRVQLFVRYFRRHFFWSSSAFIVFASEFISSKNEYILMLFLVATITIIHFTRTAFACKGVRG